MSLHTQNNYYIFPSQSFQSIFRNKDFGSGVRRGLFMVYWVTQSRKLIGSRFWCALNLKTRLLPLVSRQYLFFHYRVGVLPFYWMRYTLLSLTSFGWQKSLVIVRFVVNVSFKIIQNNMFLNTGCTSCSSRPQLWINPIFQRKMFTLSLQ